jgi:hypothetical protein
MKWLPCIGPAFSWEDPSACRLLLLVPCLAYSSSPKTEVLRSSETTDSLHVTQLYKPEERVLISRVSEEDTGRCSSKIVMQTPIGRFHLKYPAHGRITWSETGCENVGRIQLAQKVEWERLRTQQNTEFYFNCIKSGERLNQFCNYQLLGKDFI